MAQLTRSILLALSISSLPLIAEAGKDQGDGGGGGRLGQVSSGLGQATSGGGSSGGGSSGGGGSSRHDDWYAGHDHHEHAPPVIVTGLPDGTVGAPPSEPHPVTIDFYAGVQKVHESDGSLSLELAFNEGRFRIGGSISSYYERQPDAEALTFTLGALYLGVRIDDGGPTRAYLEVGGVGAETGNDPVMDSSVGGVLGGVRVAHRVSRRVSVVGDAQAMVFEQDVRAGALRAGVQYGPLQATLRYLDLNVGPALFGPEVGIRF